MRSPRMVRTAHAVAAGLEVAHAMAPVVLKAGRLVDLKAGSCRPYVHEVSISKIRNRA